MNTATKRKLIDRRRPVRSIEKWNAHVKERCLFLSRGKEKSNYSSKDRFTCQDVDLERKLKMQKIPSQ